MNAIRLILPAVAGLSAALIAYGAAYVRGDLGGVMQYLRARGALRRLEANGAAQEQLAARSALRELGQQVGDPALAARLLPLELLAGLLVAVLVWRLFARQLSTGPRPDIQERMVERLAHRLGGRFTLADLNRSSPLNDEQARVVTTRLLEQGRLTRSGDTFELVPRRAGAGHPTP
ncbi:hypothetical protein Deide_16270 [Deinococcus deserti VCD115]|uniref:Uncharacterized protein n=1 Tax=Deinococcus deserti (strain DSM 17065 / CIP 109153 / LMG 22923 / VCD115) TaxID=546414 RepID=C1CWM9_DEIDV|nr:hypothetical protein [Deinococcus deserti]ACO46596.2 hypothetical protein Deide_16270 [Deinococcus deserti VCD115]